jgi:hypothetical protein
VEKPSVFLAASWLESVDYELTRVIAESIPASLVQRKIKKLVRIAEHYPSSNAHARAYGGPSGRARIDPTSGVPFLAELIRYQLEEHAGGWHLQFDFDAAAFSQLLNQRLGRTVLLTNRMDGSTEQVVAGYAGQQSIERVFRGLKAGDWLGCDAMHHWTDRKRFVFTPSTACSASLPGTRFISRRKPGGQICPSSN